MSRAEIGPETGAACTWQPTAAIFVLCLLLAWLVLRSTEPAMTERSDKHAAIEPVRDDAERHSLSGSTQPAKKLKLATISMPKRPSPPPTTQLAPPTTQLASLRVLATTPVAPPVLSITPLAQTTVAVADNKPQHVIDATAPDLQERGVKLLLDLERGRGPSIEIAWPENALERERLFAVLHGRYGMRLGLLSQHRLTAIEGGKFATASTFLRIVNGHLTAGEHAILQQMHGSGTPVRLFPRQLDASLLAGLAALVGEVYPKSLTLRGHYELSNNQVTVTRIQIDGQPRTGRVLL